MKWLQWTTLDIDRGIGGVETHVRCLSRELRRLGIDNTWSSSPDAPLSNSWQIVHTHGSAIHWKALAEARLKRRNAIWVHTVHGLTHERMAACREFFWPGGYSAAAREYVLMAQSNVLVSIHPNNQLFALLARFKGASGVCWNGWDSWEPKKHASLPQNLANINDRFVYIGRGSDYVKGADLLQAILARFSALKIVAVPGDGFDSLSNGQVIKSGPLTAEQIQQVLRSARGLICSSRYEGLPLVVLEALAEGCPVIAPFVGGMPSLKGLDLEGLFLLHGFSAENVKEALTKLETLSNSQEAREDRAKSNRRKLKTWAEVAEIYLGMVKGALRPQ